MQYIFQFISSWNEVLHPVSWKSILKSSYIIFGFRGFKEIDSIDCPLIQSLDTLGKGPKKQALRKPWELLRPEGS